MARKKILVKDILNLIDGNEEVNVQLFAYGIISSQSSTNGMKTVNDIREKMMYGGLNARVDIIRVNEKGNLSIGAEMLHK